jgi:sulfite reductase (ferredoxin)
MMPPGDEQVKRPKHELVKESSRGLRGTLALELERATDAFTPDDVALLKFHGAYQQDDRDVRRQRHEGTSTADKKHIFMVRTKAPGGRLTAGQLAAELDLCDRFGNGTLRITTRQGLQLHGVVKGNLWETIHRINAAMLTTLGACGDVVRNVMCCPAPRPGDEVQDVMQATAAEISNHLLPRTTAYHEIWIDGQKQSEQPESEEPEILYGKTYLPRKFKIGMALPEDNCIDVHTQDVGLLAIVESGRVAGYNVLVGGGLGVTPSVKTTFPRLADALAFVPPEDVLRVLTAIIAVQRDHGDRGNRRRARLKYLVEDWGVMRFKAKVEEYLGGACLADPRPIAVRGTDDHLGWRPQGDGRFYFGLFVENGRIRDDGGLRLKTGLREVLRRFAPAVWLTPQQGLLLGDLNPEWKDDLVAILRAHGVRSHEEVSGVRRHAMACPALPTCGLAITEAERILPGVLDRLEAEAARLGLGAEEFTVRMTGCPNGCARPYTADIGLVGKAVGKYTILLGGRRLGDRLNVVYKDLVPLDEIVDELVPLLVYYRRDRAVGETLGDFCHRQGLDALRRFRQEYPDSTASP